MTNEYWIIVELAPLRRFTFNCFDNDSLPYSTYLTSRSIGALVCHSSFNTSYSVFDLLSVFWLYSFRWLGSLSNDEWRLTNYEDAFFVLHAVWALFKKIDKLPFRILFFSSFVTRHSPHRHHSTALLAFFAMRYAPCSMLTGSQPAYWYQRSDYRWQKSERLEDRCQV